MNNRLTLLPTIPLNSDSPYKVSSIPFFWDESNSKSMIVSVYCTKNFNLKFHNPFESNLICFKGSQYHHKFFNILKKYYPDFTIENVQTVVKALTRRIYVNVPFIDNIESELGVNYKFPTHGFELFCLPLTDANLVFLNPAIVRTFTATSKGNQFQRTGIHFNIHTNNQTKAPIPDFLKHTHDYAVQYDSNDEYCVYPYTIEPGLTISHIRTIYQSNFDEFGVVIHPLKQTRLNTHLIGWCNYLKVIMRLPTECDLETLVQFSELYKTDNQDYIDLYQLRTSDHKDHLPKTHGISQYGSQCEISLDLIYDIEPIIYCMFDAAYGVKSRNTSLTIENGYIFVQCQ